MYTKIYGKLYRSGKGRFVLQKQWVKQLQAGERVDSIFALGDMSPSRTKNDTLYMRLKVYDRSGSMEARIWDEEMAARLNEQYTDEPLPRLMYGETYNGRCSYYKKGASLEEEYHLSLLPQPLKMPAQEALRSGDWYRTMICTVFSSFYGDFGSFIPVRCQSSSYLHGRL